MTDIEILALLVKAKELHVSMDDVRTFKESVSRETNYVPDKTAEELVKPTSMFDDLSEDEIRYWATPYFDELQSKKEAQKNKQEE